MTFDLSQSFFALFGLEEGFDVDEKALEEAYVYCKSNFTQTGMRRFQIMSDVQRLSGQCVLTRDIRR